MELWGGGVLYAWPCKRHIHKEGSIEDRFITIHIGLVSGAHLDRQVNFTTKDKNAIDCRYQG